MFELSELRRAFSRFPTGVTVVTTRGRDGQNYGFTANSFTSVSLTPPLVLICPGQQLSSKTHFDEAEYFAINILAEGQEEISTHFATFKGDRFADMDWVEDAWRSPLIMGAAAQFSCRVYARHDAGDHQILVGEVLDFKSSELRGLGFIGGHYFNLGLERQAAIQEGKQRFAGVILEANGCVYLPDGKMPIVPYENDARLALNEALEKEGLSAKLGAVYSLYYSDDGASHYSIYLSRIDGDYRHDERFVAVDEIENLQVQNKAQQAILARFCKEYEHRNFGLYIGEESHGKIH